MEKTLIQTHLVPCLLLLLLSLSSLQDTIAVQYTVTNTVPTNPGGMRFDREIGAPFAVQTMATVTEFIWKVFNQPTDAERKQVPLVKLYISDYEGATAMAGGNVVNFSAGVIQRFPPGQAMAQFHFTAVMYHEMTHIFQWFGQGTAPRWLIEGIADYVMVKSGKFDPAGRVKPGAGSSWTEGYGVTQQFLDYCDSLKPGFTAELNNRMKDQVYKDEYFQEMLGKPLAQLWTEYKAKYIKRSKFEEVV